MRYINRLFTYLLTVHCVCLCGLQGKCQRREPPCKYLHPPQHLKEQLLQNGRNNLIMKHLQMQMLAQAVPGVFPIVRERSALWLSLSVCHLAIVIAPVLSPVAARSCLWHVRWHCWTAGVFTDGHAIQCHSTASAPLLVFYLCLLNPCRLGRGPAYSWVGQQSVYWRWVCLVHVKVSFIRTTNKQKRHYELRVNRCSWCIVYWLIITMLLCLPCRLY